MAMISSAVLGAATGTGLALLVAVTIVVYRYYLLRKRSKEWEELDRWEETKIMRKVKLKCNVHSVPKPPAGKPVRSSGSRPGSSASGASSGSRPGSSSSGASSGSRPGSSSSGASSGSRPGSYGSAGSSGSGASSGSRPGSYGSAGSSGAGSSSGSRPGSYGSGGANSGHSGSGSYGSGGHTGSNGAGSYGSNGAGSHGGSNSRPGGSNSRPGGSNGAGSYGTNGAGSYGGSNNAGSYGGSNKITTKDPYKINRYPGREETTKKPGFLDSQFGSRALDASGNFYDTHKETIDGAIDLGINAGANYLFGSDESGGAGQSHDSVVNGDSLGNSTSDHPEHHDDFAFDFSNMDHEVEEKIDEYDVRHHGQNQLKTF